MISCALFSCAPKLVTPEIEYSSYEELKQAEPDCSSKLAALEQSSDKSESIILNTIFCYRGVWKHWESAYKVLDAQIGAINEPR